jgi:hypothetical protein
LLSASSPSNPEHFAQPLPTPKRFIRGVLDQSVGAGKDQLKLRQFCLLFRSNGIGAIQFILQVRIALFKASEFDTGLIGIGFSLPNFRLKLQLSFSSLLLNLKRGILCRPVRLFFGD